jgi:hypothetical protein
MRTLEAEILFESYQTITIQTLPGLCGKRIYLSQRLRLGQK